MKCSTFLALMCHFLSLCLCQKLRLEKCHSSKTVIGISSVQIHHLRKSKSNPNPVGLLKSKSNPEASFFLKSKSGFKSTHPNPNPQIHSNPTDHKFILLGLTICDSIKNLAKKEGVITTLSKNRLSQHIISDYDLRPGINSVIFFRNSD